MFLVSKTSRWNQIHHMTKYKLFKFVKFNLDYKTLLDERILIRLNVPKW